MAVKGKAEPQATRNVAAAPCLWLAELMGSEIIQCWKVRSSTTAGAEVETNQGRNWSCGKWYCFKIINKTLFHLHSICAWQISRSGRIIPEKEYRLNAIRKDHQRHVRECLADAIFRKVLDMEVRPC